MEAELQDQGDPRMAGQGSVFDEYRYSSSATDHFYERYMNGVGLTAVYPMISPR